MEEGLEQGDGGGHGGSVAKKTAALRHKDSLLGCDAVSAGALARGGLLRGDLSPHTPRTVANFVGSEKICG